MKHLSFLLSVGLSATMLILSCKKDAGSGPKSPDKAIDSLSLLKGDSTSFLSGTVIVTKSPGDTILISLPPFTDITALRLVAAYTGKTIFPGSGTKQNFTAPVIFTVTAEDGSQIKYTVIITIRGAVYFGSNNNNFYAVDAVLGKLLWKYTAGDFSYSDPTLVNGVIYAGNIDHNMYAIDAATGQLKWSYSTDFTIESPPTVANGIVYFGNDNHHFYALDADNGSVKWTFNALGNISTKPVVLNGIVYFGSDDSYVYALNAVSGALVWKYQTGGQINASSPAMADGVLYIGCRDSNLYALDAATGKLKWKFFADNISLEMSSAAVAGGTVYICGWYNTADFTKAGSLYAVDATTGALQWQALNALGIGSSPAVADGQLYITCDDNNLYAVDINTHAVVWKSQILANGASPAVAGGIVYCGGGGVRNFYAIDAKTGNTKWMFPLGNNASGTSTPIVIGRTSL